MAAIKPRTSLFLICLLVGHVVFLISAIVFEGRNLLPVLNGVSLALSIAIGIVFFPLFLEGIYSEKADKVSLLASGIFLTWVSFAISRVVSISLRLTGIKFESVPAWILGYVAFLAIMGAMMHLAATSVHDGRVDPSRWWFIGIVGAMGGAISLASLLL